MTDTTWALLITTVSATILSLAAQVLTWLKARDAVQASRENKAAIQDVAKVSTENKAAIEDVGSRVDGRLSELLKSRGNEADLRVEVAHAEGKEAGRTGALTAAGVKTEAIAEADAVLARAAAVARQLLQQAARAPDANTAAVVANTLATDANTKGQSP